MELTKSGKQIESTSLFGGTREQVVMGVAEENLVHITRLLTDLYVDPIAATVREIISNAIDTTKRIPEADRKPINVHLPTELNLEFSVEDFGEGMSKDTLLSVYAQYGASTKGEDFSQIGAYGLGAKAPLSYANKFTVESTKDGITTEIFLTTKATGNVCEIVSEKQTGKPNGTTVTIPVKEADIEDFEIKSECYKRFSLNTEINFISGKATSKNENKLMFVSKLNVAEHNGEPVFCDLYLNIEQTDPTPEDMLSHLLERYSKSFSFYRETIKLVLSGWDYGYSTESLNKNLRYGEFVLDLKPGVVNFSSSRDEITNDERRIRLIKIVQDNLKKKTKEAIEEKMVELGISYSDLIEKSLKMGVSFDSTKEFLSDVESEHLDFKLKDSLANIQKAGKVKFSAILEKDYGSRLPHIANGIKHTSFFKERESSVSYVFKKNYPSVLNEYILADFIAYMKTNKTVIITDIDFGNDKVKALQRLNSKFWQFITNQGLSKADDYALAFSQDKASEVENAMSTFKKEFIILSAEDFEQKAKASKKEKQKKNNTTLKIVDYGRLKKGDRIPYFSDPVDKPLAELDSIINRETKNILFIDDSVKAVKDGMRARDKGSLFLNLWRENNDNYKGEVFVSSVSKTSLSKEKIEKLAEAYDVVVYLGYGSLSEKDKKILKPVTINDYTTKVEPNSLMSFLIILAHRQQTLNDIVRIWEDENIIYGKKTKELISLSKKNVNIKAYHKEHETTKNEFKFNKMMTTFSIEVNYKYRNRFNKAAVQLFFDEMEELLNA